MIKYINTMKEAHLYVKLNSRTIKCQNCSHYCLIEPGKRGICGVRENQKGKLYSLNYAKLAACNIDPIEKKPFFHFLPGTNSLSIAEAGCNMRCFNCQNWDLSQEVKETKRIPRDYVKPEKIIELALKNNLPSISYTYTEPAISSDYAMPIMKLAKKKGIKNVWVSNGFWSRELLDWISPYLDAVNIDLKSFSDEFYVKNCGAKLQPVLDTLKRLKKKNIWIEITTLAIPRLSDSKEMFKNIAGFIKEELGEETPWHISQFSASMSWQMQSLPETPVSTLKIACQIGKEAGLKYVYTGNVAGLPTEDTFCPECNSLEIDRTGYSICRHDKKGKCHKCGKDLNLIFK